VAENSKGVDWEDVGLSVRDWIDVDQRHYDVDEDRNNWPSDHDLANADVVRITFIYPNGDQETRWFGGPWNDWEEFLGDLEEWWDGDGTP
jgi:hypothetical protein